MMSSADTTSRDDARVEWDTNQARIKDAPPTKGKVYIEHVASLLNLFEPFSAINPIAQSRYILSSILYKLLTRRA